MTVAAHVKGRLMVGVGPSIYNPTESGPLPDALLTQANPDFTWVGFAAGDTHLYAAGYSGDKSLVYRIAIKDDASGLDAPVVAAQLPDGEIVRSIGGYLGFVTLGTDRGVRFAEPDGQGNLALGSLIETDQAVLCFEGQDRFMWYGLSDYDGVSTGLGRLDLSEETKPNTPAYAADLMAATQGNVTSVVTFTDKRVFCVAGQGVYAEDDTPASESYLDSGFVGFGLPDDKVAMFIDTRFAPLTGTVGMLFSPNERDLAPVGTWGTQNTNAHTFNLGQQRGERFEYRFTLSPSGTGKPKLSRVTLLAYPTPKRRGVFTLPLLLHHVQKLDDDEEVHRDPADELAFIISLVEAGSPVTYQERGISYTVIVADYDWHPHHAVEGFWDGTCLVTLKLLADQ